MTRHGDEPQRRHGPGSRDGHTPEVVLSSPTSAERRSVLPPRLGLGDLVEREDVQASTTRPPGRRPSRRALLQEPLAGEPARAPPAGSSAPCAWTGTGWSRRRRSWSPSPSSLVRSTGPGSPSSSGRVMPRSRIRCSQSFTSAGVEGQVADHVGRVPALVPHRLHGQVVVDRRVRLGVAGDADVREGLPERGEVLEQRRARRGSRPRAAASPPGTKTLLMPASLSRAHDLLELAAAGDHPRGQVRHDVVARRGEPLGQRRGCASRPLDGDAVTVTADVERDRGEHLLLDGGRGQHLVAGAREQPQRRGGVLLAAERSPQPARLVAHCAPWFRDTHRCGTSVGPWTRRPQ